MTKEFRRHSTQEGSSQSQITSNSLSWRIRKFLILGILSLAFIGTVAWFELARAAIISYAANDYSESLQNYARQREKEVHATPYEELCLTLSKNLKWRDSLITTVFANRPEEIQEISVFGKLKLMSQCKKPVDVSGDFGRQPGTSLSLLLENIRISLEKHRTRQDSRPVAIVITLHAAEPGPGQPKLDFKQIKTTIDKITQERAVLIIIGPTSDLRKNLEEQLVNNPNVDVCSFEEVSRCATWAINQARKL